jgi:hypothetical protein
VGWGQDMPQPLVSQWNIGWSVMTLFLNLNCDLHLVTRPAFSVWLSRTPFNKPPFDCKTELDIKMIGDPRDIEWRPDS